MNTTLALAVLSIGLIPSSIAHANTSMHHRLSANKQYFDFTFHPADDQEPCQANMEETHFNFCGTTAISRYQQAIKAGKINYNQQFMLVRFDVKTKRNSDTYAETYLAVLNPKTRDVYPFPFVISYDRYGKRSKTQYPKIGYSSTSKGICGLEDTVNFYGDSAVFKLWSGKACFALEHDEDGYRYPTMPLSSYEP